MNEKRTALLTVCLLGALLALVLDALFNRAAERSEQPQIWHA